MKPQSTQLTIFKCRFCGNPKPSGRIDREYCNQNCKLKAYRWRKRAERYQCDAIAAITSLAGYIDYPETFNQSLEHMKQLKTYIDDTLRIHGVVKSR